MEVTQVAREGAGLMCSSPRVAMEGPLCVI